MSFSTEIAGEGVPLWAWIQIGGWGRRSGATSAALRHSYRWSTLDPADHGYSTADADPYIPALTLPPDIVSERIDVRTGITELGDLSFSLVDPPQPTKGSAHGWNASDLLTDLLATETTIGANAPWKLALDVSSTATLWTLTTNTGITVGDSLHVGAETVIVTSVGGGGTIVVLRGQYDTQARPHATRENGGEGYLYDHPRFVLGRPVALKVCAFDRLRNRATGDADQALAASEAITIFRGVLDGWEHDGANSFLFSCRPALGRLDQTVGRAQFVSLVPRATGNYVSVHERNRRMRADEEVAITVPVPEPVGGGLPVADPQYPYSGGGAARKQTFTARFGPNLHVVDHYRQAGDPLHGEMKLTEHGLQPLGLTMANTQKEEDYLFCEVLICHPDPVRVGAAAPWFFPTFGGVKATHPIDIMLAFMTSTGDGTNGDWDTLPSHWGAAVPVGEIDLPSFRRVKARCDSLTMKSAIIGWEPGPINLRAWIEAQILSPFGWYFAHAEDGKIGLSVITDAYGDPATYPQITSADLVDVVGGGVQTPAAMRGALESTMLFQSWKYDRDPISGEYLGSLTWRPPEAERYPEHDAQIAFEAPHVTSRSGAATIGARAALLSRWLHTPLPRVVCAIGLHRLELSILQTVALTIETLPNPFTRARGMTTQPALILSRAIDLPRGVMVLELVLIPSRNVALWAPSATVAGWDAGTKTITVAANDHSKPDAGGEVPDTDAQGFIVGDTLMLLDSDLQIRAIDTPPTITAVATPQIKIGAFFANGGATVTPNAGDIVTFPHYSTSGANPKADWSTSMKRHAAEANDTDHLFPNGDPGYIYGA